MIIRSSLCRPELFSRNWAPVFEKGQAGSKVEYKIESSLFHLVRSAARDKFTHNYLAFYVRKCIDRSAAANGTKGEQSQEKQDHATSSISL